MNEVETRVINKLNGFQLGAIIAIHYMIFSISKRNGPDEKQFGFEGLRFQ